MNTRMDMGQTLGGAATGGGRADTLKDPLGGLKDPLLAPQAPRQAKKAIGGSTPEQPSEDLGEQAAPVPSLEEEAPEEETFDAAGENHTLWVEQVGDQRVIMIASDPLPVPTRLNKWAKTAKGMKDLVMQRHVNRLLELAWSKYSAVQLASQEPDSKKRAQAIAQAQQPLASVLGMLFRAMDMEYQGIGAVAVYRGIHFTTDWQAKRGRTVDEEAERDFSEIKDEGSYSAATREIANGLASPKPPQALHFEAAGRMVASVLDEWRKNTDFTREDSSDPGKAAIKKRKALEGGMTKFTQEGNLVKVNELNELLDGMKSGFTQGGHKYATQFEAALSRYIDSQKLFEQELGDKSDGGYKDVPFKEIPFVSTTKEAKEAVKYAEGKLASEDKKSVAGNVGRVLVYVGPHTQMLEAGGLDVWAGLKDGSLNFTTYRKGENEITFSGSIPNELLKGMSPVTSDRDTDGNAQLAEQEAAKHAARYGGLNPLPKNED